MIIILMLLPLNLFAQGSGNSMNFKNEIGVIKQNRFRIISDDYFNESNLIYNSYDSLTKFNKILKVGLYGSKLVPSSACQFQNSNGFLAKLIWDFSEQNSLSLDFTYIFNSVENKSSNTKSSYFNEISINFRAFEDRSMWGGFLNFGINRFSYYDPNNGVYGNLTNNISLSAGLGIEYLIFEKISIEALAKANFFFGGGRYYTLVLGLNYRIMKY